MLIKSSIDYGILPEAQVHEAEDEDSFQNPLLLGEKQVGPFVHI